jgi:hypothetical protein
LIPNYLSKNLLDGEHKEQPLQWPGQQHSGQQCQQQQLTDGAAPRYTRPADASSTPDPKSTAVELAGAIATTTTTTTSV